MAMLQHGGTLPDSSQKADFYALIDTGTVSGIVNADCSNSMGLADTKLAPITTANKVSGTSLTGLASIPAGAGTIPSANVPAPTLFGAWDATKNNNTEYTAATDGFVVAYSTSYNNTVTIFSPTATTRIVVQGNSAGAGSTPGAMCPVRKGDTWKVTGATTVFWLPLGT